MLLQAAGRLACKNVELWAAVGKPEHTQTVGNGQLLYLYWRCSDGFIQVTCSAQHYNLAGFVTGTVNDY